MENNQNYFIRKSLPGQRLSRDSQREYPQEVFPFGMDSIELFIHGKDGAFTVTEKSTGCRIASGEDMDSVRADAQRVLDAYGHGEFIELIKRILRNLNDGLEYDYSEKKWVDHDRPIIAPEISEAPDD